MTLFVISSLIFCLIRIDLGDPFKVKWETLFNGSKLGQFRLAMGDPMSTLGAESGILQGSK